MTHPTDTRAAYLLGPQEDDGSHAGRVLRGLGLRENANVALITAGWQERESEDEALVAALGLRCTNLTLHARSEKIFADDKALTKAYKARQERLRHMQVFYRTRLESADDVAHHIAVRHVEPDLIAEEWKASIDLFRQLDIDHLARCAKVYQAFEDAWRPASRKSVRHHRDELRAMLEDAQALVIPGGHVGSLVNRMRLFGVMDLADHLPIIAWSAGAMVLSDRIVCFHDYPPYGKDIAQVLETGFGVAPGIVVLPDPGGVRKRLNLGDHAGIGRFARRMAPAHCFVMAPGAELHVVGCRLVGGHAGHMTPTGEVQAWSGNRLH